MRQKQQDLWWGPPRHFSDRPYERKIGWLELLYDLVYVAAVGQLTHFFSAHLSWHHAVLTLLLFSFIFWSWVNGSQYYDLHGNDGIRTRIFTFLQMFAVAGIAITVGDVYRGHIRGFAVSLALVEILITYLWWSVGLFDPFHRVFNKFYTVNYLIALGIIIVSLFTSPSTAILLWIPALILNLTPPLTVARTVVSTLKKRGEVFTASASLVERFGLFTIIVLAESILGIVGGAAGVEEKHAMIWIAFALGILIACLLWCVYFDMTSGQEAKRGYGYMQGLIFLHYPLLVSFCILGGCLRIVLEDSASPVPSIVQWLFCASVALILFTITAIASVMKNDDEDRSYIRPASRLLIIVGVLALLIPVIGEHLHPVFFLLIISAFLLVPVFFGIRNWVRYKYFRSEASSRG